MIARAQTRCASNSALFVAADRGSAHAPAVVPGVFALVDSARGGLHIRGRFARRACRANASVFDLLQQPSFRGGALRRAAVSAPPFLLAEFLNSSSIFLTNTSCVLNAVRRSANNGQLLLTSQIGW